MLSMKDFHILVIRLVCSIGATLDWDVAWEWSRTDWVTRTNFWEVCSRDSKMLKERVGVH